MKSGLGQWLLAIGFALVLAGGYLAWRSLRSGPQPAGDVSAVTEIREAMALPTFSLSGPRGRLTNANLLGRWTFMFFGYTQCPDICPTALSLLKEVKTVLAGNAAVPPAPTFQVVFVSVDPDRDSGELLGKYMAAFDPAFIAASGDDAALAPLIKALGVFYRRNDGADAKHYTVDHSASIYLIDPRGRLAAVFSPPQQAARVLADFQRIARQ